MQESGIVPEANKLGHSVGEFVQENAPYYEAEFDKIQSATKFPWSWNTMAAVAGPFWGAARGLWGFFWTFMVLEILALVQIGKGLWGELGADKIARADKLTAKYQETMAQAEAARAAGEEGADAIFTRAENLKKVIDRLMEEADAAASGAVGFLVYNAPPAKIFMGDVGSAFLGFVFATLAIIAARYDESHTSFLVMPMLLLHFIFDTLFTFVRRVLNGQNPLKAHRTHLYQLRVRSGHTHLEVTLMLSCMAFLQGLGALWMVNIPGNERLFVFIPFIVLQAVYAMLTLKRARKRGVNLNGND